MADLKFGDRKYRKTADIWTVQTGTLRGFDAVSDESTIAMLDEIAQLRRWQEEAAIALDAATVIGQRHGTPLHWANHDRLIQEARQTQKMLFDQFLEEVNRERERYCCGWDWVPYCDTCGDEGCPDCAGGTVPNHECARWQESRRS